MKCWLQVLLCAFVLGVVFGLGHDANSGTRPCVGDEDFCTVGDFIRENTFCSVVAAHGEADCFCVDAVNHVKYANGDCGCVFGFVEKENETGMEMDVF